jgi:hypothetical protein
MGDERSAYANYRYLKFETFECFNFQLFTFNTIYVSCAKTLALRARNDREPFRFERNRRTLHRVEIADVAEQTVEMRGAFDKRFAFNRTRQGNRHTFSGDIFGNGFAFGRALFTTQHFVNEALKIRGRVFLIDDRYTLCNVCQNY